MLRAEPLQQVSAQCPRMRDRWIVRPHRQGWTSPPISEWELSATGFSDYHPHDEIVLILDGELHIEASGHTVVAHPAIRFVSRPAAPDSTGPHSMHE